MKKHILFLVFALFVITKGTTQIIVETTYLKTIDKETFIADYGIESLYDVDFFRVLYLTKDVKNEIDTASGLLCLPVSTNTGFPLLAYHHGTVGSRYAVPSYLSAEHIVAGIFSSLGYVTVAPDLLGLGYSKGIHPYLHADSQASATIDLLRAAREYTSENGVYLTDQLFLTGYSQGGHASMSTHKAIEDAGTGEFEITAAAHLSGPYSISDKMVDFTLGDTEYFFVAYLANVALSYQLVYGNLFEDDDLANFFKPEYAVMIEQYKSEDIGLFDLNEMMIDRLIADYGKSVPKNMLHPEVLDQLLNNPDDPAFVALKANDLYDWAPQAPTRMLYCMGDDQVTFENSVQADEVMNANGAPDVDAININPTFDHSQCFTPAITLTILYFSQFQILSNDGLSVLNDRDIRLYPNPADQEIRIDLADDLLLDKTCDLVIRNMYGEIVKSVNDISASVRIQTADIQNGAYLIYLLEGGQIIGVKKLIIQH